MGITSTTCLVVTPFTLMVLLLLDTTGPTLTSPKRSLTRLLLWMRAVARAATSACAAPAAAADCAKDSTADANRPPTALPIRLGRRPTAIVKKRIRLAGLHVTLQILCMMNTWGGGTWGSYNSPAPVHKSTHLLKVVLVIGRVGAAAWVCDPAAWLGWLRRSS